METFRISTFDTFCASFVILRENLGDNKKSHEDEDILLDKQPFSSNFFINACASLLFPINILISGESIT